MAKTDHSTIKGLIEKAIQLQADSDDCVRRAQKLCKHEDSSKEMKRTNDEYDSHAYYSTYHRCNICGKRWTT